MGKSAIRPQKGKSGATQSGLSLANNVSAADIESYDVAQNKFPSEDQQVQNYPDENFPRKRIEGYHEKIIMLCAVIGSNLEAISQLEATQGITFELRNHDTYPIRVSLIDPVINKTIFQDITIPASKGKIIPSFQKSVRYYTGFFTIDCKLQKSCNSASSSKVLHVCTGQNIVFGMGKKGNPPPKRDIW